MLNGPPPSRIPDHSLRSTLPSGRCSSRARRRSRSASPANARIDSYSPSAAASSARTDNSRNGFTRSPYGRARPAAADTVRNATALGSTWPRRDGQYSMLAIAVAAINACVLLVQILR